MSDKRVCYWKVFKLPTGTLTAEFMFFLCSTFAWKVSAKTQVDQTAEGWGESFELAGYFKP